MSRKTDDRRLYFAYGSNLNIDQMLQRCPTAVPVRPLYLRNWRLVFRQVADIEPAEGHTVAGALYWCEPRDVAALDRYEGVKHDLYRQVRFRIRKTDEEAFFYRMNDTYEAMPSISYYRTIEEGFADWNLPRKALQDALLAAAAQDGHNPDLTAYRLRETA
jgi:gamma-glutamylcyclotransferase (GGCT)/AIG2-like uncharacterized protein YtfP